MEPRIGHRFRMQTEPAPGFDGIVHAEVIELVPPERMVWRWQGGGIDTRLSFRLEERIVFARAGTRLRLDRQGFEGLAATLVSFILLAVALVRADPTQTLGDVLHVHRPGLGRAPRHAETLAGVEIHHVHEVLRADRREHEPLGAG